MHFPERKRHPVLRWIKYLNTNCERVWRWGGIWWRKISRLICNKSERGGLQGASETSEVCKCCWLKDTRQSRRQPSERFWDLSWKWQSWTETGISISQGQCTSVRSGTKSALLCRGRCREQEEMETDDPLWWPLKERILIKKRWHFHQFMKSLHP